MTTITKSTHLSASALVCLGFLTSLDMMVNMTASAAKAIAGAYSAPTYGSTMLFPDVSF